MSKSDPMRDGSVKVGTRKLSKALGFTLVELLVVIAIIAILSAILFPVFAAAREKARQASCASNEKQLGIAFTQYAQDYDEYFPMGYDTNPCGSDNCWYPGRGWGGMVYSYVKSLKVYECPDDTNKGLFFFSYGYNTNVAGVWPSPVQTVTAANLSRLTAPSNSVLLFEIGQAFSTGVNSDGSPNDTYESPTGDGVLYDGLMYNTNEWYETGVLNSPANIGQPVPGNIIKQSYGLHSLGSNFLMIDGHVKWLMPGQVSAGHSAATSSSVATADVANGTQAGATEVTFSTN
jgi:prepilin-type N-terminal cleavage/methylation domain-containing protein/prepilin-type processing-associated H-X9-DG protein